jgi:hypothetical protein
MVSAKFFLVMAQGKYCLSDEQKNQEGIKLTPIKKAPTHDYNQQYGLVL